MLKRTICLAAITLYTASALSAQDVCISLIQNAMYDKISTSSSNQTNSQARSNFCSWYSSFRSQNSSASGNAGIPIDDVPIDVGGSYTYASADALYQAMCTSSASSDAKDARYSTVKQYIDPMAATAFDSCLAATAAGLKGTSTMTDDESAINFEIIYEPPSGVKVGTTIRSVSVTPSDAFSCPKPASGTDLRAYVGRPHGFLNVYASLQCQRNYLTTPIQIGASRVSAKAALITIDAEAGSFTQSFRAVPVPDPLTDTAKVMSAMPKGSILAWAGAVTGIPKGWQVCDGSNGTPDLNHRIPRGTLAPGELLKKDGAPDHTHTFSGNTGKFQGANNDNVQQGGKGIGVTGYDHTHSFNGTTSGASSTLPEVTYVMFIMKYL